MVVGHEEVWVVSGFWGKWEGEREREMLQRKRKKTLFPYLCASTEEEDIQCRFKNDTVLGFFFYT
jgi:hypothetical protein